MEEKYEVQIIKMVDGKRVESLLGYVDSLDELVANINEFVKRMKSIPIDEIISKKVDKMFDELKK